jgi:hypothetical protein
MSVFKKIIIILLTMNYCVLCMFSALYCSFGSFKFIRSFIYKNTTRTFRNLFLSVHGEMPLLYIYTLIIGVISCIVLVFFFYRKNKAASIFHLLSLVPHFILVFSLGISLEVIRNGYFKYIYMVIVFWSIATIAYSLSCLFKNLVQKDDVYYENTQHDLQA